MKPTSHHRSNALRVGLVAASVAFAGSIQAAVILTVSDQTPNGTRILTTSQGSVSAPIPGNFATQPKLTYTISNLDLTSVGGTASETIVYDVVFSQSGGTGVQFNGFGNISVTGGDNNQVNSGETLTATISLNQSLTTFGGAIQLGLIEIAIGGRDADEEFNVTHDGGTINLPEGGASIAQFASSSFATLETVDTDKINDAGNLSRYVVRINIPEPSAALLGGLGLLALLRRRR